MTLTSIAKAPDPNATPRDAPDLADAEAPAPAPARDALFALELAEVVDITIGVVGMTVVEVIDVFAVDDFEDEVEVLGDGEGVGVVDEATTAAAWPALLVTDT